MLFSVSLLAIVLVASFAIDHSRGLISHRQAITLADATALSAVQALDRTITGWDNAPLMALRVVSQSNLNGLSTEFSSAAFDEGPNILVGDSLSLEIERGFYDAGGDFNSLEEVESLYGIPRHHLANSVKVRVLKTNLATPISNALDSLSQTVGRDSFSQISADAFAIREPESSTPVAPIGIPACYLFANTNPYEPERYSSDTLNMPEQCGREVIARGLGMHEVGPESGSLEDGMIRSAAIPRPPLFPYNDTVVELGELMESNNPDNFCYNQPVYGLHENCKAPPIRAYLGMPNSSHGSISDLEELIVAFAGSSGGELRGGLGQAFQAVDSDIYLDQGFSDILAQLLSSTPSVPASAPEGVTSIGTNGLRNFREVFYDSGTLFGPAVPAANFPARRNLVSIEPYSDGTPSPYSDPFAELRISWPVNSLDRQREAILLAPALDSTEPLYPETGEYHFRYTNPMCHDERIPHDDDVNAMVREFNIMLIAPSSGSHSYCDLSSLFSEREQNAVPPMASTEPVIVGFMKANFFDFRVTEYEESMAPTPQFLRHIMSSESSAIGDLVDNNPFAYDALYNMEDLAGFLQEAEQYIEDQSEYLKCNSCLQAEETLGAPEEFCDVYRNETGDFDCSDFAPVTDAPDGSAFNTGVPDWVGECFSSPSDIADYVGRLGELEPFEPESETITTGYFGDTSGTCGIFDGRNLAAGSPYLPIPDQNNGLGATVSQSCVPSCIELCGGPAFPATVSNEFYTFGLSASPENGLIGWVEYQISQLEEEIARYRGCNYSNNCTPDAQLQELTATAEAKLREQRALLSFYRRLANGSHWSQVASAAELDDPIEQCAHNLFHEVDPEHMICGMEVVLRDNSYSGSSLRLTPPTIFNILSDTYLSSFTNSQVLTLELLRDAEENSDYIRIAGPTECLNQCYQFDGLAELVGEIDGQMIELNRQWQSNEISEEDYMREYQRLDQELEYYFVDYQAELEERYESCRRTCDDGYGNYFRRARELFINRLEDRLSEIDEIQRNAEQLFEELNNRYGFNNQEGALSDESVGLAAQIALASVGAVEGTHCLPKKRADHWDIKDPRTWEPPSPKEPGYGCAGLRMRLDCSQPTLIPSSELTNPRPKLVSGN